MYRLVFYIVYPLIWLISIMPFRVLYGISDLVFLIVYYLVGYRKKLVYNNLKTVFPEKDNKEILKMRKEFYRHFVDIFMEMIKTFSISQAELNKRFNIKNYEVLEKIYQNNKSVLVMTSHYGNWEWAVNLGEPLQFKRFVVYARIQNKVISDKVISSRERFGIHLIEKSETSKTMLHNYKNQILSLYGFISDQSPMLHKSYYWTQFLGQRVPVLIGAESLAKKFDLAVVYMHIQKVKRGFYQATFEYITENPKEYKDYELTDKYLEICEKEIRENPIYYFWTHNRFKLVGKEHLSPANSN